MGWYFGGLKREESGYTSSPAVVISLRERNIWGSRKVNRAETYHLFSPQCTIVLSVPPWYINSLNERSRRRGHRRDGMMQSGFRDASSYRADHVMWVLVLYSTSQATVSISGHSPRRLLCITSEVKSRPSRLVTRCRQFTTTSRAQHGTCQDKDH